MYTLIYSPLGKGHIVTVTCLCSCRIFKGKSKKAAYGHFIASNAKESMDLTCIECQRIYCVEPALEGSSFELLDPSTPNVPPMNIPKNKNYPLDAVQCDLCGGHGCETCEDKGWLPFGHTSGRRCENAECNKSLAPNHVAVYCSNECALEDT